MLVQNSTRFSNYLGSTCIRQPTYSTIPPIQGQVRFSCLLVGNSSINPHPGVYEISCSAPYCETGSCSYDSSVCDLATKKVSLKETYTHSPMLTPGEKMMLASMRAQVNFHSSLDFRNQNIPQYEISRSVSPTYPFSQLPIKVDPVAMGRFAKYWGPHAYPLHFGKNAVYLTSK